MKKELYADKPVKEYLDDLAAKLPAPGGGSAAALSAALAAALISMVVNFTIGKPRYEKFRKELESILDKSEKLRTRLLDLTDLDVEAFKSKNLDDSLNVPFMVCRLCFDAALLCKPLLTKSNVNLITDVGVAAVFLESAFTAALLNVEINLGALKDKQRVKMIRQELARKGKIVKKIRSNTEEKIVKIIRG